MKMQENIAKNMRSQEAVVSGRFRPLYRKTILQHFSGLTGKAAEIIWQTENERDKAAHLIKNMKHFCDCLLHFRTMSAKEDE